MISLLLCDGDKPQVQIPLSDHALHLKGHDLPWDDTGIRTPHMKLRVDLAEHFCSPGRREANGQGVLLPGADFRDPLIGLLLQR